MPFNQPTLLEIRERIATDFEFRISDSETGESIDAHAAGSGYTELAISVAGVAHGLYANQQWIAEQILIATCSDEILVQRAAERGISRIEPAFAIGTVEVQGTNGTVIPAGTVFQTSTGLQFRTTAARTVASSYARPPVQALLPGIAGNVPSTTRMDFINPVPGVDSFGSAFGALSGGAEAEPIARLRERVLENLRQPPMGGNSYDYQTWARAAHVDVTRAFVVSHFSGVGSVAVRIVCENLADPIPTAGVVTAVFNYINNVRPAGIGTFAVTALSAAPMNLVFTALSPNTTEVQNAIQAEIKDLIRREYIPGGTLTLSHVREAISRAAGENDYVITLSANLTYTSSQYPTWGVPTWPA